MVTQSNEAIEQLCELLKHPDDLNTKMDYLKNRLTKEKLLIETQLQSEVQAQSDDINEVIEILSDAQSIHIKEIKDELFSVEEICSQNKTNIKVYTDMLSTHKLVKKFEDFQKRLDWINKKLSQLQDTGNTKNILSIHFELHHLEDFRDTTLFKSKDGSPDVKITLSQMFKSLEQTTSIFSECLWTIAQNCFSYLADGQLTTILHLLKIVVTEEKADNKAKLAEESRQKNIALAGVRNSTSRWKMTEGTQRNHKFYKAQLLENLKIAINTRFELLFDGLEEEDLFGRLDAIQNIPEDLKLIQEQLVPCFPPDYEAFKFFLFEYQKKVYFEVDNLAMKKIDYLEGSQIIYSLRFLQEYHGSIKARIGVSEEALEPKLFDGNPSILVEAYLDIVRIKLNQWIDNMINMEVKEFIGRTKPPKADSEGRYNMSISIIAFQMYDQQIDIASESDSARLVVEVVKECTQASISYQRRFTELINRETGLYIKNVSEIILGYAEYLISLANDQLKSVDMGDDLIEKISGLVRENYTEMASEYVNEQTAGFLKVAELAVDSLNKIIFRDVKPALDKMYSAKWYEENDDIIPAVLSTFQDYFQDCNIYLHPFLFDILIRKVMETLVLTLLTSLNGRGIRYKMPTCHQLYDKEYNLIFEFFKEHIEDNALVIKNFDPLRKILNIIRTSPKMLFLELFPIFKKFPDLPVKYILDVLSKRDDIDKNQNRELNEFIMSKFGSNNEVEFAEKVNMENDEDSSIFSKLVLETNFMDYNPFGNLL